MGIPLPGDKPPARGPFLWLLAVVLPCMITSYGSYATAKAQADAKASAGYETLLEAQKVLQKAMEDHVKADEKATVEVAAEISVLRQLVMRMYTLERETSAGRARLPAQPPPPASPVRHFQPLKSVELPPTLDAAQQMVNSKK